MLFGVVMLMSCATTLCRAQQNEPPRARNAGVGSRGSGVGEDQIPGARVVEVLPDNGYIVEIDGVKFRAITDEQLRMIQERKARLEGCEKELALGDAEMGRLKAAVELALKDAQLATAQAAVERERANLFEAMYQGERELRLQAEALAKRGRVSRFFDKPAVQIGIKLGMPILGILIGR